MSDLTKDHVPPKNLFRKPLPLKPDLITVSCCRSCNGGFSKMEERLRVFVSSAINRSADGEWIWKNKVVPSAFRRSHILRTQVEKNLLICNMRFSEKNIELPMLAFDDQLVNDCLIKITKGMLTHFYPDLSLSTLEFDVNQLPQFGVVEFIRFLDLPYIYDQRGNGEFRFLRALVDGDNRCGSWIFIFYDSISFMVLHHVHGNMASKDTI